MARNRITRGGATLAALLLTTFLVACGGGSGSGAAATDSGGSAVREIDAASAGSPDGVALNAVLSRQEAAIEVFDRVIPALSPRLARMATYFRTQEQEHVDAVLRAMRGALIAAEPSPEPIDAGDPQSDRERLVLLYELESATIEKELNAISKLETASFGPLLAATVADQGQHLTLLRQALGAGPLASVPAPLEEGTTPPPE